MTSKGTGVSHLVFSVALVLIFSEAAISATGDLDPTFGVQGRNFVTVFNSQPELGNHNYAEDIVIQPDGKILVAGSAWVIPNGDDFVILRFNANGQLDSTFANGGIFRHTLSPVTDRLNGIAVQADGKIVAAGAVNVGTQDLAWAVMRLNPNGTLDPSFGTNGIVTTNFFASLDEATEVAIRPDGKIVATGWVTRGGVNDGISYDFAVAQYLPNGTLDPSFGTNGTTFADFGRGDLAQTSVLQPDGKIVLAGFVAVQTTAIHYDFGLARFDPNGSLDLTFGTGGKVITPIRNDLDELARGIALAPDGKLVVTGDLYNPPDGNIQGHRDVVTVRYNQNGSLDTTFDGDGKFIYDSALGDRSEGSDDVVVQPDGKIVVAAKSHLRTESVQGGSVSHTELMVMRLQPNGGLDNSFEGDGIAMTDFGMFAPFPSVRTGDRGNAIALQPDGKIVVAGEAVWGNGDWSFCIARFLNDISAVTPVRAAFDFDGDGKADQAVFRPSDSVWYMLRSTSGFTGAQFGIATDAIAPADFDGDRKTDIAVFRNGVWYWVNSSNGGTSIIQFGQAGDVPVPGDYTGDGRSDLAVFRQGVWWMLDLSNNQARALQFGIASDKPVPADLDGDARIDPAVYRDGVWYWLRSSDNGVRSVPFGLASDSPIVGDFDGDRRADQAVYRSGVWHILGSTQGYFATQFGIASDIPVAADYDGDGKTDIAVYRNGVWYMLRSQLGIATVQFGVANDKPVPAAFAP